jgi:hypothetical protein
MMRGHHHNVICFMDHVCESVVQLAKLMEMQQNGMLAMLTLSPYVAQHGVTRVSTSWNARMAIMQ